MKKGRLVITQIPATKTATYVAAVLFLVSVIFDGLKGAPPNLQDKTVFHFIGNVMMGGLCVGFASWIVSTIAFAVYNRLSKRFGGMHFFVTIDEDNDESAPRELTH
jgi:hypothetical protein